MPPSATTWTLSDLDAVAFPPNSDRHLPVVSEHACVPVAGGERSGCDDELRDVLEAVLRQAPATGAERAEFLRERGGVLSERVLAVAIRRRLIRTFQGGEETGAAPGCAARIAGEEVYVLAREGAIALGRSDDADLYT